MAQWHLRGSFADAGVNLAIRCLMLQRPSLFNAASQAIADNLSRLCRPIAEPPNGAPKLKIISPLVLIDDARGKVMLNYSWQITSLEIDFYPGHDLDPQNFSIRLAACLGLGIPQSVDDDLLRLPGLASSNPANDVILPIDKIICLDVNVLAIGHPRWVVREQKKFLLLVIDKMQIAGIEPEPLRATLISHISLLLNLSVLPGMAVMFEKLTLRLGEKDVDFYLRPSSITPNPEISNDSLLFFLDLY